MNELQQRRVQKLYESYYTSYNKGVRQMQEKQSVHTVVGTISWSESNETQTIKLIHSK